MSECKTEEKLLGLVFGELTERDADALRSHLDQCPACRKLHADLKIGVKHFRKRLGDLPDMPSKLSEDRFREIIATAREFEAEHAGNCPDVPESTPPASAMSWGRTIWWGLAVGVALAFGLALIMKRPWHREAEEQPVAEEQSHPGQKASSTRARQDGRDETHRFDTKTGENSFTLTDEETIDTGNPDDRAPVRDEAKQQVVTEAMTPVKEPVAHDSKNVPAVVVTDKDPLKTITKSRAVIVVHEMVRNQLPRYLNTTPNRPSKDGLQFTLAEQPVKVSTGDAVQYNQDTLVAFGTIKDLRPLYRLSYKADEHSAKTLIDLNEQILLAGGRGARTVRYKPRSSELELIGNRQELMALHQVQRFLCESDASALNLTLPPLVKVETPSNVTPGRFGRNAEPLTNKLAATRRQMTEAEFGHNDVDVLRVSKETMITKRLHYKNLTFADVFEKLATRINLPVLDLSDQSKSKVSLDVENISVYRAMNNLCRAVDVKFILGKEGGILVPYPHEDTMQTVIFKVKSMALRSELKASKTVKQLMVNRGIVFPKGAGVGVSRNQDMLIVHNLEKNLQATVTIIKLSKWE